jgi:hypothetical protein
VCLTSWVLRWRVLLLLLLFRYLILVSPQGVALLQAHVG